MTNRCWRLVKDQFLILRAISVARSIGRPLPIAAYWTTSFGNLGGITP